MKFWVCYQCKRIKTATGHEVIPPMRAGWKYKMTKFGVLVVLCPVCRILGELNAPNSK